MGLYGALKTARENLCRAEVDLWDQEDRDRLTVALTQIDLVGSKCCPEQWSDYDLPGLAFPEP